MPEFTHLMDQRFDWVGVEASLNHQKTSPINNNYTVSLDPSILKKPEKTLKG